MPKPKKSHPATGAMAPEQVRRIQELRRSSAASPVQRRRPRGAERRAAIREG